MDTRKKGLIRGRQLFFVIFFNYLYNIYAVPNIEIAYLSRIVTTTIMMTGMLTTAKTTILTVSPLISNPRPSQYRWDAPPTELATNCKAGLFVGLSCPWRNRQQLWIIKRTTLLNSKKVFTSFLAFFYQHQYHAVVHWLVHPGTLHLLIILATIQTTHTVFGRLQFHRGHNSGLTFSSSKRNLGKAWPLPDLSVSCYSA